MSDFAVTFYFKDIFSDFNSFKDYINEYTDINKDDILNVYIYKYMYSKYCNSNINYDTIDSFKRHFGITYEDTFEQLKMRRKLIDAEYNLTLDEITVITKVVNNFANNGLSNNAKNNASIIITNPLEQVLPYIDYQNTNKSESNSLSESVENKFNAYLSALNKITDRFLMEYLYIFSKHFMMIVSPQYYNY